MIETTQEAHVAIVTLARPEARNALTSAMLSSLETALTELDANPEVHVIVLTGKDPAFCSGLDLKDLARTYNDIGVGTRPSRERRGLLPIIETPLLGAINGAAVTGGLELALGCDFLLASHRATFADTHARVGVMPGGGMTIRLPQLIGINRARQMSMTGDFVDAGTACEWGLVNEVVPHGALMERTMAVAQSISEADPAAVREIRSMYHTLGLRSDPEAYREEARWSRSWMSERFDPATFATRRDGIIERGSSQQR